MDDFYLYYVLSKLDEERCLQNYYLILIFVLSPQSMRYCDSSSDDVPLISM